jgi:hypothetical protein
MMQALVAIETEARRATKIKNPAKNAKNEIADGKLAVSSVTSPNGSENNAMNQCEKGGFDGTD